VSSRDGIIAKNPLPDYLRDRGFSLHPAGSNLVTNACPVKEHRKLHLCVTIDTAQGLWHCNDHEQGGTVIDWVMHERNISAADAMLELGGGKNGQEPGGKIVCAYDYTDEAGKLLFQCVRYEPKDFKQRRPDDNGGWIRNIQGVRRVLYHLPQVIAAQTICIAEGEKDCDNLAKLGFVTTTNVFGAGKWRDEYSKTLHEKDVIVFGDVGDDDGKGEKHTQQVIESLTGKANSIKHPAMPEGFHDVSDYIESFSSEAEAKTAIQKLIEQATSLGMTKGEAKAAVDQPRVAKVEPPETAVTLSEWREAIAKNFPSLARPAEICLSVEAQLLLNDVVNPFALALVDVPASGKTITLNFFKNPEELAYTTDYFTAAAFSSNARKTSTRCFFSITRSSCSNSRTTVRYRAVFMGLQVFIFVCG
jgi:5S rRNA maturation endonuclease (ribonuclease M5)